jgi:hypothetical protein
VREKKHAFPPKAGGGAGAEGGEKDRTPSPANRSVFGFTGILFSICESFQWRRSVNKESSC